MNAKNNTDIENEIVNQVGLNSNLSSSIAEEIEYQTRHKITPIPNISNNSTINQDSFPRRCSIPKSRSFSISTQKEIETSNEPFLSGDDDSNFDSIYVTNYDPEKKYDDNQNHSERGLLNFEEDSLVFLSEDGAKDIKIPLIGHIESAMMPHPSNFRSNGSKTLRLLSLTYLANINDNSSVSSVFFAADQKIIRPFLLHLISKSLAIQKENNYKPPNLKIINVPDFINHPSANIQSQLPKKAEQKYIYHNSSKPPLPTRKFIPHVKLNGGESSILKEEDVINVRKYVPIRYRSLDWDLLYKLSKDGCSYTTFYKKTEEEEQIIFLLKTSLGERIGAYLPSSLKPSTEYYGSGDSFVFQLDPAFAIYKWSKLNQFFVSSTREEFSIGGGGHAAIWIDGYFNKAFSEECETFKSPKLTKKSHFTISEVEVWKIGRPQKKHTSSTNLMNRY